MSMKDCITIESIMCYFYVEINRIRYFCIMNLKKKLIKFIRNKFFALLKALQCFFGVQMILVLIRKQKRKVWMRRLKVKILRKTVENSKRKKRLRKEDKM